MSHRSLLGILFATALLGQTESQGPVQDGRDVILAYAAFAHAIYGESRVAAEELQTAVESFLAAPDEARLTAARRAWIAARKIYGQTEVLRFSEGPIDDRVHGKEPLINAWPVDESYIDEVLGRPGGGIIGDPVRFPLIEAEVLIAANERGGEANVCTGWHAIEFLLWGQDFELGAPGRRPAKDFIDGEKPHADRRRQFLRVTTALLVQHLRELEQAWSEGPTTARTKFLALAPPVALRRIATGLVVLSGFELAGERMAVALETGAEEDEHSCFSDTTKNDMVANQEGIAMLWRGTHPAMGGVGFSKFATARDAAGVAEVERRIDAGLAALKGLPEPFELALTKDQTSPHRQALETAIRAIEVQAEALAAVALKLGYDIPMTPGG